MCIILRIDASRVIGHKVDGEKMTPRRARLAPAWQQEHLEEQKELAEQEHGQVLPLHVAELRGEEHAIVQCFEVVEVPLDKVQAKERRQVQVLVAEERFPRGLRR